MHEHPYNVWQLESEEGENKKIFLNSTELKKYKYMGNKWHHHLRKGYEVFWDNKSRLIGIIKHKICTEWWTLHANTNSTLFISFREE